MKDDPIVKGRLNALTESDYYFTCPIVKDEILFGIKRLPTGSKRENLKQKAEILFSHVQCDPIPENVPEVYDQIKVTAKEQGIAISESDLWIAATAIFLDAILVTSDGDYTNIVGIGLRLENWEGVIFRTNLLYLISPTISFHPISSILFYK